MKRFKVNYDCIEVGIFADSLKEAREFLFKSDPQFVVKDENILFQWNETSSSIVTIKECTIEKGVFQVNVFG